MSLFNRFSSTALVGSAIVAAGVLTMAVPAIAQTAPSHTYAYVNISQEVNAVTASDWQSALATAPNIDPHSGVLLLTSQNSGLVK